MRDETFVPCDIAIDDAIGSNAAIVAGGEHLGEDILIGIFASSAVPSLGCVRRDTEDLGEGAAEFIADETLEQTSGVDLGPVWQLADQIEIDAHGESLVEGLVLN